MAHRRAWLCVSALLVLLGSAGTSGQDAPQPASSSIPTLRVTSNLVFLDVTVLDKRGQPVVTGLTKDDFTITEDGKPQRIFSFEAPDVHALSPGADEDNPDNKAPVTILVLDLLNSRFEDFAYIRYSVRKYLMSEPEQLTAPVEMLVVGNWSLDLLEGYTRSRADLLYALDHLPAALPIKHMNAAFYWDRVAQSIDALQQIALQNKGVPGRKNILWVGHGGPNLALEMRGVPPKTAQQIREYVHMTTNMLVDARMSLFVIYPGLPVEDRGMSMSAVQAGMTIGDNDPFAGDVNFGLLSNETGGRLYYNRNDVDREIARAAELGSNYYTLTYQPEFVDPDGKFRRVRVMLRNRSLRVVTKAGYYAPDDKAIIKPDQQRIIKLEQALHATIPINALEVSLGDLLRHPDSNSVQLTAILKSKHLDFLPDESGKGSVHLLIAAASLDASRRLLSMRVERIALETTLTDHSHLPVVASRTPITVGLPRRARTLRLVVEDEDSGRIGADEIDRAFVENAPEAPTSNPDLVPRPPTPGRTAEKSTQ
jgi:VWFA-related protein